MLIMALDHLGDWLRARREARGWTQVELAQRMRTAPTKISRWERGANHPTLEQFAAICRALKASADDGLRIRRRAKKRRRATFEPVAPPLEAATAAAASA